MLTKLVLPWYNGTGWLGLKHQLTYWHGVIVKLWSPWDDPVSLPGCWNPVAYHLWLLMSGSVSQDFYLCGLKGRPAMSNISAPVLSWGDLVWLTGQGQLLTPCLESQGCRLIPCLCFFSCSPAWSCCSFCLARLWSILMNGWLGRKHQVSYFEKKKLWWPDCTLAILLLLIPFYWRVRNRQCASDAIKRLTIEHILLACSDFIEIRESHFTPKSLRMLFKDISPEKIFNFLNEINRDRF